MHQTQSLKHQHKILVKTMLYSNTNYNFKNRDFVTDGELNKRNNNTQQSLRRLRWIDLTRRCQTQNAFRRAWVKPRLQPCPSNDREDTSAK